MPSSKLRVVIVGGNFAGLAAASKLCGRYEVTVVDRGTEFEWTPNIHEILSGVKHRESVVLSRADCVERYGHRFVRDLVTQIDTASDNVITKSGLVLPYDACIVAAGSQKTTFQVPGAERFALGLRRVDDAVRIGRRLDKLVSRKRKPTVVIVGGGISGIETVGELLRRRDRDDAFDLHVVEQASRVLPQQPPAVAQDVQRRAAPYDVHWHIGTGVTRVTARTVTLAGGKRLSTDLCIWSAGMALPDFLQGSSLSDDQHDWLPVEQTLQSRLAPKVFIAGDCAELPTPLRKQAYYAIDMGNVAGSNVGRFLSHRTLRDFHPRPGPLLVAFGDLTTWLVAGDHVVASPLLAAAKEGVYQATMARFASPLLPLRYSAGVVDRTALAARRLLLPQLRPSALIRTLSASRIL